MIIEQHYDDEVLIGLLNEAEEDSHVPACDTCAGTLESYRDLSSALHEQAVWDEREVSETPSPKTANFLRSFAERTKAEDAAARPIVAKLIADPALIDQHPEWRTAGVVRGLLKVVDEKNFSEPKAAAELAALAVRVADAIEPGVYALDAVTKLRARAHHEHAYALYTVGSFNESITELDAADTLLRGCTVSAIESANVALHRAQVFGEIERTDEGIELAARAAAVFRQFGSLRRVAVADATRGGLLMFVRRYSEALAIHERLAAAVSLDDHSRAIATYHAAVCYRELRQFSKARQLYAHAAVEFERLSDSFRRVKARWGVANVFSLEQRYADALTLFTEVRRECEELGMAQDVALSSLDAAEALLMLNRLPEVAELCQRAIDYFASARLEYTRGALTALAYLREAAENRIIDGSAVRQVRNFFEILPKQPHLLFAFPL